MSCKPGTFQPDSGQASCLPCTNGTMCPDYNTTYPVQCKLGFYCPTGMPFACPNGTYGKRSGLKSIVECSDCPAGKYCPGLANISPSLLCAAGWYCEGGASSVTPYPSYKFSKNGRCEKGMFHCSNSEFASFFRNEILVLSNSWNLTL